MLKPFKIKAEHLKEYSELEPDDIGLYALRVKDGQELMIYENKSVAQKAYEYFKKNFK